MKRALFLACLLLIGCARSTAQHVTPKGSLAISWSSDISARLPGWVEAWERYLNRPVLVLMCHGGPDDDGTWILDPDWPRPEIPVEHAAWVLRDFSEGRQVVILSCNEAGSVLHVPGVKYARQVVASKFNRFYPGRAYRPEHFFEGQYGKR